ncbi:sulfotransferase [Actinotalea sp.]|uniref:sulfotransferase n=1 Tax=Actinotalea sp. TaxID=1872145 RepID=UPI002C9D30D8|nr:sulfotransferase [Actinotalea sp.]HQY33445.1 sulfotransferase [Actinotalea sp.]HRA49954.1 sulfotransferase [Actinotalea sp.]
MSASLLVVVGTDHHPFDRAVAWADAWAHGHPEDRVTIQYGTSTPPAAASGVDVVAPAELDRLMHEADVVITHGGPGTISAARAAGHLPLILPRNPAHGEHVDDHQMRFSAWADRHGLGRRCVELGELTATVEAALLGEGTRAAAPAEDDRVAGSIRRLSDLLAAPDRGRRLALDAPTVVYLGGFGRSGSTLLERLLATLEGTVALGEVVHLWERGIAADDLCGCGQAFSSCPFWTQVGEAAFGGWDQVDLDEVRRLHAAVDRQRKAHLTLRPSPPLQVRKDLASYTSLYRAVYDAALAVSGARTVIDSSKHGSLAIALGRDHHIDLRVVHVVRDPRAVVHSWAKEVERPETRGRDSMTRFSPVTASALWASNNLLIDAVRLVGAPVHLVRYEDLVARPQQTVDAIWAGLGLPGPTTLPMVDDTTVELGPIHSVAGNPMRFRHGPTVLRTDEAWRTMMPRSHRRLVGALTAPIALRFGYPTRAGRSGRPPADA